MQVGEVIPLFPTFGIFCQHARVAPHVLPHEFAGSMEGYYQVFWMDSFILTSKIANPNLPYPRIMFELHDILLRYVYPQFGGPIDIYRSEFYPQLPTEVKAMLQQEGMLNAYRALPASRNLVYNCVANAADKLNTFMSGYAMTTPVRKSLKEISPYTTLSGAAAKYLDGSSFLPLESVPNIVNTIKSASIIVPGIPFPRLSRLDETVQFPGVPIPMEKVLDIETEGV